MVMMAGDQYRWIKTTFRETDMNNIGFAPLPAGPGGIATLTGGDMYMVSAAASADEKEAATYFELWRLLDPTEVQSGSGSSGRRSGRGRWWPRPAALHRRLSGARARASNSLTTRCRYDNYSAFLDAIASGEAKLQVEPAPLVSSITPPSARWSAPS